LIGQFCRVFDNAPHALAGEQGATGYVVAGSPKWWAGGIYGQSHLNLLGLPEGSAFSVEMITDAMARRCAVRTPEHDVLYVGFVDMSGGSNDDACLAIAHLDADGRAWLDVVINQGPPPPFDLRRAVERFVLALRQYGITCVVGDKYAGETFRLDFERAGISYDAAGLTRSQFTITGVGVVEPLLPKLLRAPKAL
jgi:hypothetical protein